MKTDNEIRDFILFHHEKILHEKASPVEYGVPDKYRDIPDDERRGMIRALRWVLSADEDEYR